MDGLAASVQRALRAQGLEVHSMRRRLHAKLAKYVLGEGWVLRVV